MAKKLILECSKTIAGHVVDFRVYEESFTSSKLYTFEQSAFLQDETQATPYYPGSGAMDNTLEGILLKLNDVFPSHYHNIIKVEKNPNFKG